ncbi:alpha-ketoglutarate-dependent dioxygenase AlkB [Bordetella genomosp. 10]|uniref:Alpha-ketoglutarate-dependent dioxygenase AlkB n=1 Tax=Bordetella genomosp. 10 TaxID=1416804 RepID=A0A261SBX9_9BORD|nr:DNA oxidative demethylase AlkB [Bordetella genomosp. 10]OZI34497.1 alpha-ketoglutarate-dependent dioxygenase AlkB [Bordetella genomosp. 10]
MPEAAGAGHLSGHLFGDPEAEAPWDEAIAPGAVLLRRHACARAEALLAAAREVVAAAPMRHLVTPGGQTMSVAMTNCGEWGWVSDRRGYRYDPVDPASGRPWPPMPAVFLEVAREAAARAGYPDFAPQACLMNLYRPGARLTLHQDRDELDLAAPIVSVSLGLPAIFLFGGLLRSERPRRYPLQHGDVAVWGGPSRLAFHGVAPLAEGHHPATGAVRLNLTFRKTR